VIEGVAYDARTSTYLLSSINRRNVLALSEGSLREMINPRAGSLLGIALDPETRTLWACSAVSKLMREFTRPDEQEHSELLAIDLDRAAVRRSIPLPKSDSSRSPFCDSVVVTRSGDVYVTDGGMQSICLVRRNSTSITGLIGIQNGAKPARVLVMYVGGRHDAIERVIEVDTRAAQLDEPTWGTTVGNTFVFVANSQNETARTQGESALKSTVLMEFAIPSDC
jgi:hypothetical protein